MIKKPEVIVPSIMWLTMAILTILKALGMISLSWWWIFIPIWLPFALVGSMLTCVFSTLIVCFIVVVIIEILEKF